MIRTANNGWRFVLALVLGASLHETALAEEIHGTVAGVDGNRLRISVPGPRAYALATG
jgi:hypothetical protein